MTDSEQPLLPDLIRELTTVIGRKLIAYAGAAESTNTVDRWIAGEIVGSDAEQRLRLLYRVIQILHEHDSPGVIQAQLIGLNPELGDRAPLRVIREDSLETASIGLFSAASAFVAGGKE